jgi:preprotein translocase subunit SecG
MGSQSAFGTKAGDTFTRITIVVAIIWVVLAGGVGMAMRKVQGDNNLGAGLQSGTAELKSSDPLKDSEGALGESAPFPGGSAKPADEAKAPPASAPGTTKPEAGKEEAKTGEKAPPASAPAPAADDASKAPAAAPPAKPAEPAEPAAKPAEPSASAKPDEAKAPAAPAAESKPAPEDKK